MRRHEGEGARRAQDLRAAGHGRQGRWHLRGEEYVAIDVRFSDRLRWLFWPEDLEEVSSSSRSWWRSLIGNSFSGG